MQKITLESLRKELPRLPSLIKFEGNPLCWQSEGVFYKLTFGSDPSFIIDRESGLVLPHEVVVINVTDKYPQAVFALYTTEGTGGTQKWKYIIETQDNES